MQDNQNTSLRKRRIKYTFILLLWLLLLIVVINIYRQERLLVENRAEQSINVRKFLENYSDKKKFPELKLNFQGSEDPTYDELIVAIEDEYPSLPFRYWFRNVGKALETSPNCAKFPDLVRLNYYNKYWQTFQLENITFQLYSAYYDKRPTVDVGKTVRILAMINITTQEHLPVFYCQLWYEEQFRPVLTKASLRMIWYSAWGHGRDYLYPHLVTCLLPLDVTQSIPKVVSLVSTECERAKNSLRVGYEQPQPPSVKQQFAVCVKGMDYPNVDLSARLVEWIELQRILGASKIYFYLMQVHPNVTKVLQYYTKLGLIDVKPITLATGVPYIPQLLHYFLNILPQTRRLNEIIPYNDCFYRNIYNYDYIALEDIFEVLMPLGTRTSWAELVELASKERTATCRNGYGSYCFRNVYFPDFSNEEVLLHESEGLPNYMHILRHINSRNIGPERSAKCLHRTDRIMSLHNHYPIESINVCPSWTFSAETAQLNNYNHAEAKDILKERVTDKNLWRFKDILLERSLKAFKEMHFVKDES